MMRKIYIPYIVFCILIITLFVINLSGGPNQPTYIDEHKTVETKEKVVKNTPNEIKPEKERDFYIVKAMENNIYLYDKNNKVLEKLNINYNNLREYDKNQFITGIEISDMSGVYQLIEDFSN